MNTGPGEPTHGPRPTGGPRLHLGRTHVVAWGLPRVLPHALMALSGAGGPGVSAHTGDAVSGLEHDAAGTGMEIHQVGKAESVIRSRCLADTGPPRTDQPALVIAFRRGGTGENRYGWIS